MQNLKAATKQAMLQRLEEIKAKKEKKRSYIPQRAKFKLKLFDEQSGTCNICFSRFKSSKDRHLDHCHATGKVRELLCYRCNIMLGFAKDDILILKSAVRYLKRHGIVDPDEETS